MNDRKELLLEFNRLLEKNGFISIIKHNRADKIMQKAVFEYDIDEAWKLLENGDVESANFGTIKEYDDYELEEYCRGMLKIHKVYGLRIFSSHYSLAAKYVYRLIDSICINGIKITNSKEKLI